MTWTSEAMQRLRELVESPWNFPARVIAEMLVAEGFFYALTKNAIVGKCHRLGLSLSKPSGFGDFNERRRLGLVRPKPPKVKEPKLLAPKPREPEPELLEPEPPALEPPADGPVTLFELNMHKCRWPLDDGMFCGDVTVRPGEKPYCEEHSRKAYDGLKSQAAYKRWLTGDYISPKRNGRWR